MRDLVVVAVTACFFALCVVYVRWCDRIIGPDPDLHELDELSTGAPGAAPSTASEVVG